VRTRFTELVGCREPLQLAALGGVAGAELAAAVSGAGALGMLPAGESRATVEQRLGKLRALSGGPFGVNFLVPFLDLDGLELAAAGAPLVELFSGWPDEGLVARVHEGGALASWQVGSADEARAAAAAGCDLIVAQGVEAGGHVRGVLGLLPLLDAVLAAVEPPVLAAGGIGSGRAAAAALAAGADGVRVGTRFLGAAEARAHPDYVAALIAAAPEDTVLTEAFWRGWPDAPHRVLRSCVEALERQGGDVVATGAGGGAIRRASSDPPAAGTTGTIGAMALYAGQSVGSVRRVQPAAEIVRELMQQAEALLARARPGA
jgi:NAD(P)H-dependent flavin oxidoreductase YrpB (nitropropane dioxygenase family)